MQEPYLERALFVVGHPNAGKSVQLRSMFRDIRFDPNGKIPTSKKVRKYIRLSNERTLILRLTSPHEWENSPDEFMNEIEKSMGPGRSCFAGALQPDAENKMPDVVESVRLFVGHFSPERTRICFLSPDWQGNPIELTPDTHTIVDALRNIESVECMFIDARNRASNGLLLAEFFDFT